MKKTARMGGAAAAALFAALLLAGCEPTDWEAILAPPPPVSGLAVVSHAGTSVQLTYTLPAFEELARLFPEFGFRVYYYSRPAAGGAETYTGTYHFYDQDDVGTTQTPLAFDVAGLAGGTDYVLVAYTEDEERQRSAAAESAPFTW